MAIHLSRQERKSFGNKAESPRGSSFHDCYNMKAASRATDSVKPEFLNGEIEKGKLLFY